VRQHLEIGKAAAIGLLRRVTADALKIIALKIELPRLKQTYFRQARMLFEQCIAERRPEPLVLSDLHRTQIAMIMGPLAFASGAATHP
jgi:hypothetical protein